MQAHEAGYIQDNEEGKLQRFLNKAGFAVADRVRATVRETIAQLKALGIGVAMLTGDNRRTGETVSSELGIDKVASDVGEMRRTGERDAPMRGGDRALGEQHGPDEQDGQRSSVDDPGHQGWTSIPQETLVQSSTSPHSRRGSGYSKTSTSQRQGQASGGCSQSSFARYRKIECQCQQGEQRGIGPSQCERISSIEDLYP